MSTTDSDGEMSISTNSSQISSSSVSGHDPRCDLVNPGAWAIAQDIGPKMVLECTCDYWWSQNLQAEIDAHSKAKQEGLDRSIGIDPEDNND